MSCLFLNTLAIIPCRVWEEPAIVVAAAGTRSDLAAGTGIPAEYI